jgi:antitoxin component of MazEF toxin-antitoxin module
MKVRARVRRIGNSLGIIIPSDEASASGLMEGDSVEIEVSRRANVKELFGTARFSGSAQDIKDEARRGWDE